MDDCRGMHAVAVERGATQVHAPAQAKDDNGEVWQSTIQTYGDCTHTFIERAKYNGAYLPGFTAVDAADFPVTTMTDDIGLQFVDHVVGNQPDDAMLVGHIMIALLLDERSVSKLGQCRKVNAVKLNQCL